MVKQRTITIFSFCQVISKIGQHFDVVLIDFRELINSTRVFTMMGSTMKPQCRRITFRIDPTSEITGKKHSPYSRDVSLKCQRLQVKHQLDMIIKRLGNPRRHVKILRSCGSYAGSNLQTSLYL